MDDLISRQWLMECVNEGWIKFDTEKDENRFIHLVRDMAPSAEEEPCEDALGRAENAIGNLPSAQLERTCVNCGRTANNGGWYADGRTRCPIEEHYALPKDGFCHLWEKRNITDDDYPERRTDEPEK